uniref:RRM domain-containing protein n=1 Tax=Aotus nancymaae TaxID=37293 RepID=A0A2K5D4F9_AOTNA
MAALTASGAVALRRNVSRPVAFVRKIPWTAASSQLREHFAQFGHIKRCIVPFESLFRDTEWTAKGEPSQANGRKAAQSHPARFTAPK